MSTQPVDPRRRKQDSSSLSEDTELRELKQEFKIEKIDEDAKNSRAQTQEMEEEKKNPLSTSLLGKREKKKTTTPYSKTAPSSQEEATLYAKQSISTPSAIKKREKEEKEEHFPSTGEMKKEEEAPPLAAGFSSQNTPQTIHTPGEKAVQTRGVSGTESMHHPYVMEAFEEIEVAIAGLMKKDGINQLTIQIEGKGSSLSPFVGTTVTITQFSTAPLEFNLSLSHPTQSAVNILEGHKADLVRLFQTKKEYSIHHIEIEYSTPEKPPLIERKGETAKENKDE